MFDVSPVSTTIGPANQNQDFSDRSSDSIQPSLEQAKPKSANLKVLHPNAPIPGRWWGLQQGEQGSGWNKHAMEKRVPFSKKYPSVTKLDDESSLDEYFETTDKFVRFQKTDRYSAYSPLSSALKEFDPDVKPHMTEPLLPDGTPLDFSPLASHRGETNVYSATPLARVWEFNSGTDKHEYSVLNILADEFENLDENLDEKGNQPRHSLWSQFKKFTVGLSEDEYDDHYPWAKYCIRSLSEGGNSGSDADSGCA